MANENVIQANFNGFYKAMTDPAWFIDHGMQLSISGIIIPPEFECHFSNSRSVAAKRQIGENGVVTIPDEYFLSNAAQIFCWIYLHPTVDSGVTEYEIVIPLRPRSNVDPAEPTQEQQDIVDQAIAALNVAMEQTGQDVTDAAASASAALASERAAAASEVNAAASERAAALSETNAGNSATDAHRSELNASASESAAASSAADAYRDAERAEQAANTAGYMDVEIIDGRLIYTRTDAVDVDFELNDNGHLLMEVI